MMSSFLQAEPIEKTPITCAKQYMDYLKEVEGAKDFVAPKTVLITFGSSHLNALLKDKTYQVAPVMRQLHVLEGGKLGILGGFGMGAPALIHRIEELIAIGVERFVLVGLAGSLTEELAIGDYALCTQALGEDGVTHLYVKKGETIAKGGASLRASWSRFIEEKHPDHSPFLPVFSWTFPVMFKETVEDLHRVSKLGCKTVEMEAAALYAIAQEKNVEALALFVISDSLAGGVWHPKLKESGTKEKLVNLSKLALDFLETMN